MMCATEPDHGDAGCLAAETLAAHGRGLGTCLIGFAAPWLNLAKGKKEFQVLANYVPASSPDYHRPSSR